MKEFIKGLKYQIKYCMTEDEKEFIDIEDLLYYEFGEDPTSEDVENVILSLEKEFKIKRKNFPTKYISVN